MSDVDRQVDTEVFASELTRALEGNPDSGALQFFSSILSITPYIGGFLSEQVKAPNEKKQADIVRLLLQVARNTNARLDEVEERLVDAHDPSRLYACKVVFTTKGTVSIAGALKASSITDNGVLDFTINFEERIWPYTFQVFGSGQVFVVDEMLTEHSLRIKLADGAPERVAVFILPG